MSEPWEEEIAVAASLGLETDEDGFIDWEANGWPEPNPYGAGRTGGMPPEVLAIWHDCCGGLERMWEDG